MRFPVIPVLLLALPFIEIAGFVIVGRQIGVLATLALVVASGIAGAVLLRVQGFGVMTRLRRDLASDADPSRDLADGAMVLLAAILLLIPGFVTDIAGLLLFMPPVRRLVWHSLKRRIVVSRAGFGASARTGARAPATGDRTIDLDAGEYRHERRADSPWRPIDRD